MKKVLYKHINSAVLQAGGGRAQMAVKTSSKYKGVYYHAGQRKWCAAIQVNGKYKFIGYFDDEIEAAKEYDRAARAYHGEFAVLNFKPCPHRP